MRQFVTGTSGSDRLLCLAGSRNCLVSFVVMLLDMLLLVAMPAIRLEVDGVSVLPSQLNKDLPA